MVARRLAAAALLLCAAALAPRPALSLSWPLCEDGGQVWVTERPRTEPTFPGANLWFFCESGLNLLGVPVSPCIDNGTVCAPAVANALCQAFGFDRSFEDDGGLGIKVTNATQQQAVRSLTGEYCLRAGVYSDTVPEDLASLPGEPCQKIDGITCIRERETIITALDAANLAAFRPAPPAAEPVEPADLEVSPEQEQKATQAAAEMSADSASGGGARRLLKLRANRRA